MDRKKYLINIALFVILLSIMGCSGANAECKVKAGKGEFPQIIVNPPGETGEAEITCKYSRHREGSPGTSSTNYTGECTQYYGESGNTYTINVINIYIVDNRLESYRLEVTGGVYGTDAHICESP
ncbi:MAG: hypothetical protein MUO40_13925 [Anaerolineaceae bacterium]|nr:hypothetical protein [Anaerolineaceae bacterium]